MPPPQRLTESQWFGVRFFLVLAGFSVLAWVMVLPKRLGLVQEGLAYAAAGLAQLTGSRSTVARDHIQLPTLSMHINFECTGIYVILLLLTFLIAYPASWRSRITGALIGIGGLTLLNVVRLSFLVRLAELQPDMFDYFHEYVWQGFFLVLVIAYAMTWVEHAR